MFAITDDEQLAREVEKMRAAGTDLAECELKAASDGFPKSTVETMSAFANTTGGAIVFGIREAHGFHPVKGFSPKEIQSGCAQAAREGIEPALQVDIRLLKFEESPVIVANVPELTPRQKPCYVRRLGQRNGSYIRTGDGDHKLTPYEIDRFIENQLNSARHDASVVPDATLEDFDAGLLEGWLASERMSSFGRAESLDVETLLANRRAIAPDEHGTLRPTLAGIMALGSYPQKFFPRLNVVFSRYPNSQKGSLDADGKRFVDSANLDGPVPQMVADTLRVLSRNIKHGAIVEGALREDVPDYPLDAVREAVANALMHRDYSPESQGEPVLVDLYPDRLEISNPGGLYGSLTVDQLGQRGGTTSRNQSLSRILEEAPYTDVDGRRGKVVENRGTGYQIIRNSLASALMESPVIDNTLDGFRIVFRHRSMTEQESAYSKSNVSKAVLDFIASRESVSRAEVARAAGVSNKTAGKYINDLIEQGLVEGLGTQNSPKRRYRLIGKR